MMEVTGADKAELVLCPCKRRVTASSRGKTAGRHYNSKRVVCMGQCSLTGSVPTSASSASGGWTSSPQPCLHLRQCQWLLLPRGSLAEQWRNQLGFCAEIMEIVQWARIRYRN